MAEKLWGSWFTGELSSLAKAFTYSTEYDVKLAVYDCFGSIAHANMLGKQGIISQEEAKSLEKGLVAIIADIKDGTYVCDEASEDIHTDIQNKLKERVGSSADKLHTARSRNDQVVLDMKMYSIDHMDMISDMLTDLQKSIVAFADKNIDVIIPAYTHLQSAQLVLMSHHMLAYVEMLDRDKMRIWDCQDRTNVNPLGSCALSGSTLPIDRDYVTEQLGFDCSSGNSMDSVADRDFLIELVSVISIMGMHLSRICEDLILWVTKEFDFIDIDDAFCTGSSIMPHKKNPDVLELVRGATAKFSGRLCELLVLMKALPLTYNRDMQWDKPAFFDCVETVEYILPLMNSLFKGIQVKRENTKKAIDSECFFSVDILEYLVGKGVSYREAHDTVGKMIKECVDKGERLVNLDIEVWKKYSVYFEEDVKELLNPETSVTRKKSIGSTNPEMVKVEILKWKEVFEGGGVEYE